MKPVISLMVDEETERTYVITKLCLQHTVEILEECLEQLKKEYATANN